MQVIEINEQFQNYSQDFYQKSDDFRGIKKEREQGIRRLELYGMVTNYHVSFVAKFANILITFRIDYDLLNMLEYDGIVLKRQ